jgi:prepilin peptidase CpaA
MPVSATIDLVALLGFVGLLAAAAISDARHLIVPNRYCLAVALLYGVHVLVAPAPVDWVGGMTVGGVSLAVGFVLFTLRVFGGGDAKLFAATSLWAGPLLISDFVFSTAVAGALLAVAMLVGRRLIPVAMVPQGGGEVAPAASGRWQRNLPYGIAIAAGGALIAVKLFLGR